MEPATPARPLDALEATIRSRAEQPSESSYTSKLLRGDIAVLCGKLLEEAAELAEAAEDVGAGDSADVDAVEVDAARKHFVYEAGDLVYHLLVLLRRRGVALAEVEEELARRFGVSGLAEKAARGKAEGQQAEGTE